jgi:6-phosphogluconolactonase
MVTVRRWVSRSQLFAEADDLVRAVVAAGDGHLYGIMFSGGETPRSLYQGLVSCPLKAPPCLRFLPADERMVPESDASSNVRQIRAMAVAAGMGREQVLAVDTRLPLDEAAQDYESTLLQFLDSGAIELGFLGLGADGHTASLFTVDDVRQSRGRLAVGVRRAGGLDRVSVTADLLASVRRLVVLVVGAEKVQAVDSLGDRPYTSAAGMLLDGHARAEVWFAPA